MAKTRQAADRQEPPAGTTGGMTGPEWAIMKVVWEKEPCAAGTVQEALESSHHWAYSTVKTTMDRMAAKGILATQAIRNLTLFSAQISRADAQRSELRRVIGRAFDGALTPLIQFLAEEEELTRDEIAELRKLIKRRAQS